MKDTRPTFELHAFVDEELDVSAQLDVERALAEDAALRTRVQAIRDVRGAIRRGADYHPAPDALRRNIEAMVVRTAGSPASDDPQVDARTAAGHGPQRSSDASWLRRGGARPWVAACAATVALTVATQFYFARANQTTRLADEVVASHVRSTLGEHPIDIASSDHHAVKPWLSSKLDFSPPVRDVDLGDAVFLGARVDYLEGRPVAALVYRLGPHVVDAFIWPGSTERRVSFGAERGFEIAHWTRDGMNYWVVSDVNRAEFTAFVDRLAAPREEATPAR